MGKFEPVNILVYRWRYTIGYIALAIVFMFAISLAGLYAPGGITQTEIDTIQKTSQLAEGGLYPVNILFHALQWGSFELFGVSTLSIKLPAMLLAVATIISVFFLLRQWFKTNITILAMLIMATTGQLIFLAQSATSHILYVLLSSLILLFSSLILKKAKKPQLWKILLMVSVGLSLYTPYFAYVNLGLLVAALIHPRTRYHLLHKSQRKKWLIAGAVFVIMLAPLIYLTAQNPAILHTLSGLEQIATVDILANLSMLQQLFFGLQPGVVDNQIAPIFGYASLFIMTLGGLALFRQSYTARSYVITAWLSLTIPILVIDPGLVAIVVMPLFILLALGVETLLHEWYKLFPKNPYARGAGLVLAVGLIGVMVFSGIDRFSNGYRHMPEAVDRFSIDLSLLRQHLSTHPARTQLIVSDTESPLYTAYATYSKVDIIVTKSSTDDPLTSSNILFSRQALAERDTDELQLVRIITSDRAENADRFYLYKTD